MKRNLLLVLALFTCKLVFAQAPQTLPFSQNWTNAALITIDDNWNNVPGIQGRRGDNITGGTGVDPQTLLAADDPGVVDVNANRNDPNTFATGGTTEFDGIANPAVALSGSATADAPYLLISINTLGKSNVRVQYNVRDLDASIDNAIQQVALQYRIGNSGAFTNIPAGYVADGTSGPSLATLVTAVDVILPAATNNNAEVQLRIMTSNAVGNDEWVAIDDINITADCDITNVTFSNAGTCNNNGTPGDPSDDYFTADVTVDFINAPATGLLQFEPGNDAIAGGGDLSVSVVGLTSPHTFTGVRFKADGTPTVVEMEFSAQPTTCVQTAVGPTVESCSVAVCDIISAVFSNAGSCNNNGTDDDPSDDYFTADVTVTFENAPATGFLQFEPGNDAIAGGGDLSVSVTGLTSPYTFTGVRFKADGTPTVVEIEFSAEPTTCVITVTGPTVESCSVPCNIVDIGLSDVHCENNNESSDANDDYIWFQLNPTGSGLGTGYDVQVFPGTVLLNGNAPATNVPYGMSSFFRLQQGSAGAGDVLVFITDVSSASCTAFINLTDPGSCSQSNCDLDIVDISVSDESCPGENDGSITVTATCTTCIGDLEYSIDGVNFQPDGNFTNLSPNTYTITVREFDGDCSVSAEVTVQPGDDIPPQFEQFPLPADFSIECDQDIPPPATLTALDQNEAEVPVIFGEEDTPGNCPQEFTRIRTWTATDACGNTATHTQVVTVTDNTPPTLENLPPATLAVDCADPLPDPADVTASDNCDSNPTVDLQESEPVFDDCPQTYTFIRTWTATDACGNSSSFTQTVTVTDQTPPVFNQDLPQSYTADCGDPLPMPEILDGTDNCDPGVSPSVIFINEIHYDNAGTDAGEFIEIAGTAGINLSQYQIVLYNGANGTQYGTTILSGIIPDEGNGFGAVAFPYPSNGVQNGAPDGIAFGTTSGMLLQFLSYEGAFVGVGSIADGVLSTDIGVLEDGTNAVGTSLQLTGTGQQYADFTWGGPVNDSPGTLNDGQELSQLPGVIIAEFSQMVTPGECNGEATITRMWTVTDACGNSTSHTQIITLLDNSGPFFIPPLPQNITINCQDPVPAPANLLAADACDMGNIVTNVWINEIHYDNTGADVGEFVEIAGTAGTDLSQYQIVLYNGNGGAVYDTDPLVGVIPNLSNGFGTVCLGYPSNGIQNGAPDGIALVHNVMGGMVVQFLSYEGVFVATGGPANGMTSTDIGVLELGTEAAGMSVRLVGSGNEYSDFSWAGPGTATNCNINVGQTFVAVPQGPVVTFGQTEEPGICPQERTITRTWTATDDCGNTSTHTQVINVVDDTAPVFNAPLPANLTLNCQDVVPPAPTLTATDNCDLTPTITFNEVTTPGLCAQQRTITRTWRATDDCGNTGTYTQTISIVDVTGPTIVCKNATVNLDIFGNVSVLQSQILQSVSDNCTPGGSITVTPAGPFSFNCGQEGTTQSIVLTAKDACGNSSSCTAQVTINPFPRCTPKILISDPCVCKNNATTLTNGQFGETIKIESLAGKTWTVIANTGFYSAGSPAPPFAPILVPIGTTFTQNPIPSGDYYLSGLHVDAIGYSITVRSETGQILTIGNSCQYPNPEITSDLSAAFCLFSNPVDLTGTPGDNNIVSQGFTVNGVPATQFNPGQGVGSYVITYTVNGGTPKAFGANDPGCIQSVSQTVHVIATPEVLNCNDLLHVSLDGDCEGIILPDDVLEGSYGCYDDYLVELDRTLPYGNGPWTPATIGVNDIGKTYQTRVTHLVSGNHCWGSVKIEDKLEPTLTCEDISVPCNTPNLTPAYLLSNLEIGAAFPNAFDCQDFTLTYIDSEVAKDCNSGLTKVVTRKWTAIDASGNSATCIQLINLVRPSLDDVQTPPDYDDIDAPAFHCTDNAYPTPEWIEGLGLQGFPHVFGFPSGCSINWGYEDHPINICDGTYKIRREWTIIDWCLGDGFTYNQIIKVLDNEGPVIACPADLDVSIDPFNCCATVNMPDAIIEDNCSRINNISGMVVTYDPYTYEESGMHLFGGTVTDFPGNNHWTPDTLGAYGWTPCLPIGSHLVTYIAEDDCGNTSSCEFYLNVIDYVPPVAECDQTTTVGIGGDDPFDCYFFEPEVVCEFPGVTWVKASTFDDGSYDQCGNIKMTVRRMEPYSDCIENGIVCDYYDATAEADSIKFYCCEVGTTQTVILRVYQVDVDGNVATSLSGDSLYNECMVQVEVQDKLKPFCAPPPNVTVTCEQFDPSLWLYGTPKLTDNCCLDETKVYRDQCGLTHSVNYSQFDTLCNKGTITRTFRAFDCAGNSSQCSQRIVVNYEQDYYVRFPNDVIVTVCDGTGNFGEPTFFGEDCELLGVTFEDAVFTVVPDACFKIERNWKIINWCTYRPEQACINVPNPNPNAITNHPTNLPGPIVSPIQTVGDPWKSTIVKVNPGDALATNYSTFYDPNANCYTYKQVIKIIDTQDPVVECPASPVTICDLTPNDPLLWNEMYWWDNHNQSHDLCEAPSDICITATDACSGANINIEYQLFLDLDGDGIMETVVNSTQLGNQAGGLGWNNILFGNATGAGVSRQFDGRPVPTNQKWGFAIQETVSGVNKTACVKFNTFQAQNTYVTPQLPYGIHKIKWFVSDGCGNETVCEYTIVIKDCKAPSVVCLNGLSVNIMPTGMITLWATDFLQYGEDNCTEDPYLKYSIRKCGQGTGFPTDLAGGPVTNLTFTCDELGTQCVELWAIDLAGNADYCETYVIVQDNAGSCGNSDMLSVAGNIRTETDEGIGESSVEINGSVSFAPPFFALDLTDASGHYEKLNSIPITADYVIRPVKDDNPLNGVTTYDLVLITQHILGIAPLGSPYKMIAADANKSNSITTFDVVEIRKVILGTYQSFPANTSWRFVDKAYVFPNPANPFVAPFPETIAFSNVLIDEMEEHFVGVKIGDVNNNVITSANATADDRTAGTLLFDVTERDVQAGDVFEVSFKASDRTLGYQMTLNLNGLTVENILSSDNVNASNFGVFNDALTVSINDAETFTVKFRATKSGKLSQLLGVSSRITKAEAYAPGSNGRDGRMDVALRFVSPAGMTTTTVGVGFELYQNEPNPFVSKTFISFNLPEATAATLTVFDETGRMVYTQKGDFAKGYNTIALDRALINTTGLLYYTLETATDAATRKMIQSSK